MVPTFTTNHLPRLMMLEKATQVATKEAGKETNKAEKNLTVHIQTRMKMCRGKIIIRDNNMCRDNNN